MNIYLVSPNPEHLESVAEGVEQTLMLTDTSVRIGATLEAAYTQVRRDRPQTLMVEVTSFSDLGLIEKLLMDQPELNVVAMVENQTADFLLKAMRVGVREVLAFPIEPDAVAETLNRLQRRMSNSGQSSSTSEVWAFMPVRGGAGATFIATNLAYALAEQHDLRVILIDLNLPFGEAEVYVSAEPAQHCLADITEKTDRLDEAMLNSVLVKVHPKLGILATGDQLERSVAITPEQIGAVISLASQMADYVFIDVNPTLTGVSLAALDRATRIVPILEASFPAVRNAKRMTDLFRRLGYSRDKITPMVNRYDADNQITPDDIGKALDLKIWQVLPNRPEVANSSINQGVPVINLKSRDSLSRLISQLASNIKNSVKPEASTTQGNGAAASSVASGSLVGSLRSSLFRWKK